MSVVNENVAREYFESLGFLVTQPHKYVASGKRRRAEEDVDLLIVHPTVKEHKLPGRLEWATKDLLGVRSGVVAIRGWHSSRFSESTFRHAPDILGFVEPETRRFTARALGSDTYANILCLPGLPTSRDLKDKVMGMLKTKGIDGVLSFQTMLLELIAGVDVNRNYEKSDLLQTLRILKRYDLITNPQMELFAGRHRRKPAPRDTAPSDEVKGGS